MAVNWVPPFAATLVPNVGGFIAHMQTQKGRCWYVGLSKPWWCAPNWLFAPMWGTMYVGMGYASYLVWEACDGFNDRSLVPLGLYGTQLALNWAWTPIFFGWHKLGLATIEIGATWLAIVGCVVTFHPVSKTASYLMLPYLGWVSFASCLTFWIWRNNPSKKVD
ncbi:translocator protein-like isoform X4 [Branchiostoma floridae x Branchiostoma belcheri]